MPVAPFDLEFLLAPVAAEEFFSRHWEQAPLVVSRREPGRYASLLGVSDLDFIISTAFTIEKSAVEALGNTAVKKFLKGDRAAHVAELYDAYRRGATLRVNRVQRYWKPLREACRGLERRFGFPARANLYCTPGGAAPSKRHYDTHDVFVLQISGRKSWRVFRPVVELPLANVPPLPFEERSEMLKYARGGPRKGRASIGEEESGPPLLEFTLEAGDLLYMPRGFVHEAWTADDASAHVTVGLHVLTWLDLLTVALARVSNRDVRFRRALPVRFSGGEGPDDEAGELFAALAETFARQAGIKDAFEEVASSFVQSRQAVGDGTLAAAADGGGDILGETLLEHRPGLLCRYARNGATAGLVSAHSALWMPEAFAAALRFVARTAAFRVRDIPGGMTENSKLALARRLIQDGFVRVAASAE